MNGCYGCGGPILAFGGMVWPAVIDSLLNRYVPRRAVWWTQCVKCGVVEKAE